MDNKRLACLNELVWGGNKTEAGKLKKLITEPQRTSNQKFIPRREIENCIDIIIASNEEYFIPA